MAGEAESLVTAEIRGEARSTLGLLCSARSEAEHADAAGTVPAGPGSVAGSGSASFGSMVMTIRFVLKSYDLRNLNRRTPHFVVADAAGTVPDETPSAVGLDCSGGFGQS